jgi:hypothetical protein
MNPLRFHIGMTNGPAAGGAVLVAPSRSGLAI